MVSVVIPLYNREGFIARAIDSVLAQTKSAFEIIVVNDGSTDNSAKILEHYHDKIVIITQENSGVSAARNVGIKKAKGNWIAFLDSDDTWHPTKLQKQLAYHDSHPSIMISHTAEIWMRNGKEVKQKKIHQKPQGWCFEENVGFCKIAPSTTMIARSLFEDVGYFDESLVICEDYDLWLRILRQYELGFLEEELTTKYAGHEGQLSFSYPVMDQYRIKALLKHDKLAVVQQEIIKKATIILKGAKKHQNDTLFEEYQKIVLRFSKTL